MFKTAERVYKATKTTVMTDDITKLEVEATANPANSRLVMGGGVAGALAIGLLLIRDVEALTEALFGDITQAGLPETIAAIIISPAAIILTKIIYNKIVLSMISEELATSTGVKIARTNLFYLLLVSLVVAIGIKITGTLLVGFLVVVPAAAAKSISSNLHRYSVLNSIFGALSSFSGVLLAGFLNLPTVPPGPLVVLSGIVIFLIAVSMKWMSKS